MTALSGIVEYEPSEFTFTALAGTPLAEVNVALVEHGQYLPFDPLLVRAGATLGGTVAAGTSGPGRFRYGGVRDFIIGIRYADGDGTMIKGGGKVVKNAAGFDLPKLMVGSLGRLGILYELSFKVFPAPAARLTGRIPNIGIKEGIERLSAISRLPFEFEALELEADGSIVFRIGGDPQALKARLAAIPDAVEVLEDEACSYWSRIEALDFKSEVIVKVPTIPSRTEALDEALQECEVERHYSAGANVCYVSAAASAVGAIGERLRSLGLSGLILKGDATERARIGRRPSAAMEEHVKNALDPAKKFPEYGQ